jgi:hypothetical protein
MPTIVRSFRRLTPASVAVLMLAVVACATAEEPDDSDNDGTGNKPSVAGGNGGGSGGMSSSTAGNTSTAGKPPTTTGGTPATSSGGQVGSGGAAGGTPPTTTAGTAAGGATTGTCPPYAGTLATDSAIFVGGFGKSTVGTWSGYGYTYKYGTATIAPGMGNSCFVGKKFCANGSVPADDKSGAGLGWNIGQAQGATATMKVAITTPVTLTFAGVSAGMRVQLSATAALSYCYTLTAGEASAGSATIPYAKFETNCWATGTAEAVPYDGVTPIEAIQIAVPGSTAGPAKAFDLCVLDVEPG